MDRGSGSSISFHVFEGSMFSATLNHNLILRHVYLAAIKLSY